ncbi:hypothetical protein [Lederbergia citrea]|uniref:hypothetical protein n=1 Tax=Lederbergia citrea TaxID=2833581 RepID=UPI001BC9530D|nr:hypothetical protein [Lederbergia citrea]MBS4203531.1 hypothetical protein [Lederbergia citrea]
MATLINYIQVVAVLIGLEKAQRKQMAIMSLVPPIMIGFISLNVPAALTVGGLFMIVQALIIKNMYIKYKGCFSKLYCSLIRINLYHWYEVSLIETK